MPRSKPFGLPNPFGLRRSGLLFVPRRWQRAGAVNWLKRVHAWTGFWGALLFLMLGTSGVLLNHRNILKIDTGAPVEVGAVNIPVRPGQFADGDALAVWAKQRLALPVEGKPPPAPLPDGPRSFLGKTVVEPAGWTRIFTLADARVTVEHIPGAAHVSARRETIGMLNTLKNLHKGTGLGLVWVLFLDTIAGALIAMSLTGFLLWSGLHGSRLLAGAIALASLVLAAVAIAPSLG